MKILPTIIISLNLKLNRNSKLKYKYTSNCLHDKCAGWCLFMSCLGPKFEQAVLLPKKI